MRPLSEATSRIAGKSFSRKYVALGRIVQAWDDIVGKELASKAQPVKIHYRKNEKDKKPKASLDIAVSTADATILHYQKDLILERINQIFGEQWISAIRFVNTPANAETIKRQKRKKPLTQDEKNNLSGMLLDIEDKDIRSVLERLGTAVIEESKT